MKISSNFIVATLVVLSVSTPVVVSHVSVQQMPLESSEQMPIESSEQMPLESSEQMPLESSSVTSTEQMPLELSETSSSFLEDSGPDSNKDLFSEDLTTSSLRSDPNPESLDTEENGSIISKSDTSTSQKTSDGMFTDEQKAIWIDRHNFFRVAGLPWAAGNMERMNWDDSLAQDAATAASSCTAKTKPGLNVFEDTTTDPATVLEDAIIDWIVKPAITGIANVVPPSKEGESVGAGLYNSYTQIIWSSTTGVGCAMASCNGGATVACAYSPPGNDGKSPWFIHAAQAKNCPSGTVAQHGLCVVEGDPKNDLIAPIPDGFRTHQIYPNFISDIMGAILKAQKERDAPGAVKMTAVSPGDLMGSPEDDNYNDENEPLQLGSCAGSTKESQTEDIYSGDLTSEEDPGTVKASSASGLSFSNQEELLSNEAEDQTGDLTLLSQEKSDVLTFSASDTSDSGMSTAAFAVFVSYFKQEEQMEEDSPDRIEVI
ncbi:putative CAP superfamily protein [Plasmopara halstedii]